MTKSRTRATDECADVDDDFVCMHVCPFMVMCVHVCVVYVRVCVTRP